MLMETMSKRSVIIVVPTTKVEKLKLRPDIINLF